MREVISFFEDINIITIAMIAVATFAGGLWFRGREKLRQLGELFLAAHEYTDDKRLSNEEREDLIRRFFEIIGKSKPLPSSPELPVRKHGKYKNRR